MARKLHAGRPGGSQLNARTRAHTVRKVASSVPFKHEYERFFLFFSKQNEIGWSLCPPPHLPPRNRLRPKIASSDGTRSPDAIKVAQIINARTALVPEHSQRSQAHLHGGRGAVSSGLSVCGRLG